MISTKFLIYLMQFFVVKMLVCLNDVYVYF